MSPIKNIELFLSTQSINPSFTIASSGVVIADKTINAPNNADTLPKHIQDALDSAGLSFANISLVVVNNGPGSFTGIRSGAAFGFGLTAGSNKTLTSINSFDAIEICYRFSESQQSQKGKQSPNGNVPILIAIPFRGENFYVRITNADNSSFERLLSASQIEEFLESNKDTLLIWGQKAPAPSQIGKSAVFIEANSSGMLQAFSIIRKNSEGPDQNSAAIFQKYFRLLKPECKIIEPYYMADPSISKPRQSEQT